MRMLAGFCILGFAVLARTAVADDAPTLQLRLPPELMWHFHDGSADLTYALVGFSDGTAAVQATAQIVARGPHGGYDLWESWLLYLDREGQQTRSIRLPDLRLKGTTAVRGLQNANVLVMLAFKGTVYVAQLTGNGQLLWDNAFDSGTFGFISAPLVLSDRGYLLFEDYFGTCSLRRLNAEGRQIWQREFANPEPRSKSHAVWAGVVISLPDGGFIFDCGYPNDDSDSVEQWLFRVDAQGKEIWHRRFETDTLMADARHDGLVEIIGRSSHSASASGPVNANDGGWIKLTIDKGDEGFLDVSSVLLSPEFNPNDSFYSRGDNATLSSGGWIWITRPRGDLGGGPNLSAARLSRDYRFVWQKSVTEWPANRTVHPAGVAELGNGIVLIAVNAFQSRVGAVGASIYMLPGD
jgi:hypothetical protein